MDGNKKYMKKIIIIYHKNYCLFINKQYFIKNKTIFFYNIFYYILIKIIIMNDYRNMKLKQTLVIIVIIYFKLLKVCLRTFLFFLFIEIFNIILKKFFLWTRKFLKLINNIYT